MDSFFEKKLITTKDASELSGYTSDYLGRLVRLGKIDGEKIGHNWLIERESLTSFLKDQKNRKIEFARTLAQEREKEYRAHRSPLRRTPASSRLPVPPHATIRGSSPFSQFSAVAVALLVVVSGALAAQAEVVPQLGERAAEIANETAFGFNAAFGGIPYRIAEKMNATDAAMRAADARVAAHTALASERAAPVLLAQLDFPFPHTVFSADIPARPATFALLPSASAHITPLTFGDMQSSVLDAYAFLTSPARMTDSLDNAYVALGARAYDAIVASLTAYQSLIAGSGSPALALGTTARDWLAHAPRFVDRMNLALGESVIGAAHAAIRADVAVSYGFAAAAPESARATALAVGSIGDALAGMTTRTPAFAAAVFLRTTQAPATLAPALAQTVFSGEYAVATHFVALTDNISGHYLALVSDTGTLAYAGTAGALALAQLTPPVFTHAPTALENAYLGLLGNGALALDSFTTRLAHIVSVGNTPALAAVLPALSTGEQAALFTYQTIHGFFSSATGALASLFGTSNVTVVSNPPPAVLPFATSTMPVSTPPAVRIQRVAVTNYPTYTTVVKGVSQDFVNQSLASLRANILATVAGMIQPVAAQGVTNQNTIQYVNMIQDLSNLTVHNGNFLGGTFDGGNLTNGISVSATSGNFTNLTGGNTSLATTSISGSLTTTGNVTLGGTLTAGSLSVSSIASGGAISAPYFTATSSTATSTFSGSLNVDNGGFVYATSTRNVGIGVLSPAALLALQNSTSTQPIFVARSAAGAEVYRITDSGFVGIGTTSPTYALSVEGSSSLGNNAIAGAFTATTSTATSTFAGPLAVGTSTQFANGLFAVGTSSPLLYIDNATGRIGVGTSSPAVAFDIFATDAMRLPVGTSAQRPLIGDTGYVRYNTTTQQFEGYGANGVWQGLGGVIDADQDTKITADTNNLNEDYLRFFTKGVQRMTITNTGLIGIGSTSPFAQLSLAGAAGTTTDLFAISTSTAGFATSTALTIDQNGNLALLNGANLSVGGTLAVAGNTTLANATTTALFSTTASSTNLFASNAQFGSLAANSLALSTALPVTSGGTGWAAIQSGAIPYGNGTSALATTSLGVAGNILALLNGIPTWTATTTFSSGLAYSAGNVTNTGVLSLAQTYGTPQTGALTFATTSASWNGLTLGTNITNTSGAFTFSPALSGTLNNSGLTNSTIALATGSSGTDVNVSGSPASLGGTLTLNIPTASATNRGALSPTDWSTFNSKQAALTFTYPLINTSNVISTAFGTTTANSFNQLQQFNAGASTTQLTTTGNTYLATAGGNVGIGTTLPTQALTVNGNIALPTSGSTITGNVSLTLSSTNGTYGPTSLILENTTGANGPVFSTAGSSQNLIDFGFIPGSGTQQNIRLEARTGSQFGTGNSVGEFQIGPAGAPNFIIGAGTTAVRTGNFGVGTVTPSTTLSVAGSGYLTGGLGVGVLNTTAGTLQTSGNATIGGTLAVTGNTTLASATSTNFAITNILSSLLKTNASGSVIPAVAGTDYLAPTSLSATTPLAYNSGTGVFSISQANTSTSGFLSSTDWNTFNNKVSSTSLSAGTGISYNPSTGVIGNTGLLSLAQTYGSAQTGALTFATSSAATANGVTVGQTITNTGGAFTFTPTVSVANIPNSALANSTIGLSSSDSSLTISGSPASLGGVLTANLNTGHVNTFTAEQNFNGNASVSSTNYILFNGPTDTNWRMGYNTGSFTHALATTPLDIVVGTGTNDGFAVGGTGGNSLFELKGSNNQAYFRGNVGIGTTDATGYLNIASSGATPTIFNPSSGNGIILRGDNQPGGGGQLRVVYNTGGWSDATSSTYFQITNASNNNATFMGGTYGTDTQLNRLQFNASSTQFTDVGWMQTPVPGALLSIVSSSTAKTVLALRGATGQTADYLQISTNGGALGGVLDLNSSGNLGIGTTSPATTLSVAGNAYLTGGLGVGVLNPNPGSLLTSGGATITGGIDLIHSGIARVGTISNDTSGFILENTSANPIIFQTNGANERMRIDASGNIGIGTTSPYSMLSVAGQVVAQNFVATSTTAVSKFSGEVDFGGGTQAYANGNWNFNGAAIGNVTSIAGSAASGYNLTLGSNNATGQLIFDSGSGVEAARFNSSGFLGIGTTTPGSLLSIGTTNGINFSTATSTFSSTGGINLTSGCYALGGTCLTTGVSSVSNSDGTLTISPTTGAVVSSLNLAHPNTWTALQQFNGNASTTQLTTTGSTYLATAGGNVGIGTTTPGYTLTVNGNVNVTGGGAFSYGANLQATGIQTIGDVIVGNVIGFSGGTGQWLGNGSINGNYSIFAQDSSGANGIPIAASELVLGPTSGINGSLAAMDVGFSRIATSTVAVGTGITGTSGGTLIAGKIGIGTTSPSAKLAITGSGTGTGQAFAIANSLNQNIFTVQDNSQAIFGSWTSGNNALVVNPSSASFTQYYNLTDSRYALSSNGWNDYGLHAGSVNLDGGALRLGSGGSFSYISGGGQGNGILNFFSGSVTLPALSIVYGNVGIGTTSPYRTLSVSGSGVFAGGDVLASTLTATSSVTAPTVNATTALQLNGASINTAGTLTNVPYLNQANTFTALNQFNGNASTTQLTTTGSTYLATAGGNVGIGTAAPGYTLDVNGTINASTAIQVTSGNGVFGATGNVYIRA
ncbi:MAG: hypothetical protein ACYCPH_01960, partial [Minisyncoccota bacterium]